MRNKGERGAVTLFIIGTCMFIITMLVTYVANIENKKQAQDKEIEQIVQRYEQNEQDMERIYTKIVESENTNQ